MTKPSLVLPLESPFSSFVAEEESARDILLGGLNWATDYWRDLAIGWLEEGALLDQEIADRLTDIASTRTLSQRTRHRAAALLRHRD